MIVEVKTHLRCNECYHLFHYDELYDHNSIKNMKCELCDNTLSLDCYEIKESS